MKLFINSSFFIALTDKSDIHFSEAEELFLNQINNYNEIFTTNLVISETITRIRYRAGFRFAKEFGEQFRSSKIIKTIWVNEEIDKEAWKIFIKYSDKSLSYVNCVSIAFIKIKKIEHVFTFDKHFKQVGLIVLP
jgi:predicted nucleic acid-binding protein